jgi:hypothetical protein
MPQVILPLLGHRYRFVAPRGGGIQGIAAAEQATAFLGRRHDIEACEPDIGEQAIVGMHQQLEFAMMLRPLRETFSYDCHAANETPEGNMQLAAQGESQLVPCVCNDARRACGIDLGGHGSLHRFVRGICAPASAQAMITCPLLLTEKPTAAGLTIL